MARAGVRSAQQVETAQRQRFAVDQHYPGTHLVEVLVNGKPLPLGSFDLLP